MHTNDVFMCGSLYDRDALGLIDFDSSIDIASKRQRYYELCKELISRHSDRACSLFGKRGIKGGISR